MQSDYFFISWLILFFFFLIGAALLIAIQTAIFKIGKVQLDQILQKKYRRLFFYRYFFRRVKKHPWENFNFLVSFTKNLLHLLYTLSLFLCFFSLFSKWTTIDWFYLTILISVTLMVAVFVDFFMRLLGSIYSQQVFKGLAPLATIYLLLFFPISSILMKIIEHFYQRPSSSQPTVKQSLQHILKDTGMIKLLDANDQKMLLSFATFREKVAREIMTPRIAIFSLPASTTIKEATKSFLEEDYSRIPIYEENLDSIQGVLMYKDILKLFGRSDKEREALLNNTLESIVKPVIYAPENKRISHLFQEFKKKKIHMAIIVNEYGGTEGIVTIEDILEELVGEIADEYDTEEAKQFWQLPGGEFIVDAKMSIIDIENKINIRIPHHPEYETIGGFVFHRAGTIPSKGWKIHHDDFELEVLISNEKCIEKIRITPLEKDDTSLEE